MADAFNDAIREVNSGLSIRKLREIVERSNMSADMKALLIDIAGVTAKVAGKVISIGRKILTVVFDLVKLFPAVTLGVIAALVITSIISSIPFFGAALAASLSSIIMLLGIGKGALQDLSNPALDDRLSNFISSISALAEM